MKQALILCGGKAQRLKPYSYSLPKACMPFLNLPLLSLGWFYLEQLGVSRFFLNAHLFPEKLKQVVNFLSQPQQKAEIFFEDEPLGGAGTLYKLKNVLQKTQHFFYLNGDSLFFPLDMRQLSLFEEDFLKTDADGSFFACPLPLPSSDFGALWCDRDLNLKFVGPKKELPGKFNSHKLSAFYFSGLALFKSTLLDSLKEDDFCLFQDFINPLLERKTLKVFSNQAVILEAGEKPAYIKSLKFCMECLFETEKFVKSKDKVKDKKGEVKKILKSCFARFDPQDQVVGLKNGKAWSKELGCPLLAPESVRGLEKLELKGVAALGSEVQLFGQSILKDSVLGSGISWRGTLGKEIVLKISI